jgi:hypothetical protein
VENAGDFNGRLFLAVEDDMATHRMRSQAGVDLVARFAGAWRVPQQFKRIPDVAEIFCLLRLPPLMPCSRPDPGEVLFRGIGYPISVASVGDQPLSGCPQITQYRCTTVVDHEFVV